MKPSKGGVWIFFAATPCQALHIMRQFVLHRYRWIDEKKKKDLVRTKWKTNEIKVLNASILDIKPRSSPIRPTDVDVNEEKVSAIQ